MSYNEKYKKTNSTILVVDVEACCWRGNPPEGQYKEIIEIGVVSVDYFTKKINDCASIIVKPDFSEISSFCTELTTLTPEYVEKHGVSFQEACNILTKEHNSNKKTWVSWGDYDRIAFEQECKLKNVEYPFGKNHVNLKEWHAFQYGLKNSLGVSSALKRLKIEFDGTRHRGVDDAKMTAVILQQMIMR